MQKACQQIVQQAGILQKGSNYPHSKAYLYVISVRSDLSLDLDSDQGSARCPVSI